MCCFVVKTALYSSTDVANLYLAKGSAKSLHDMIIYQSQTIYPLWNNIADAIRLVFPAGRPILLYLHQEDLCSTTAGTVVWETSADGQRTSQHGVIFSGCAGRGRTRMKRLSAFQQKRFSRPFTGLCFLYGVCGSCVSPFTFFILTQI